MEVEVKRERKTETSDKVDDANIEKQRPELVDTVTAKKDTAQVGQSPSDKAKADLPIKIDQELTTVPLKEETLNNVLDPWSTRVTLRNVGIETDIIKRSGYVCKFVLKYFGKRVSAPYLEYVGPKIKNFNNPRDFPEARMDLVRRVITEYEGVPFDYSDDWEQIYNTIRLTVPNQRGMDVLKWRDVEVLSAAEVTDLVALVRSIPGTAVPDDDARKRVFDVWAHPYEVQLQTSLARAEEDFVMLSDGIRKRFEFLSDTLTNEKTFVQPYTDSTDLPYRYLPYYVKHDAMSDMVCNNFVIRKIVAQVWEEILSRQPMPVKQADQTITEWLMHFNVRVGTFSALNKIPSKISSTKAVRTFRNCLAVAINPRLCKLYYPLDHQSNQLGTILDILCIMMFGRLQDFDPESVIDMKNYIANYLVSNIKQRGNALPVSKIAEITMSGLAERVDYLDMYMAGGAFDPELVEFFRGASSLWFGGRSSNQTSAPLPRHSDIFLGGRRNGRYYVYYAGQETKTDNSDLPWVTVCSNFLTKMSQVQISGRYGSNNMTSIMQTFATAMRSTLFNCSKLAYVMDKLQRSYAIMPSFPMMADEIAVMDPVEQRILYKVDEFGYLSMMQLMEFDNIAPPEMGIENTKFGDAMASYFNQLCHYRTMIDEYLKNDPLISNKYTKTERLRMAINMIDKRVDPGITELLDKEVVGMASAEALKFTYVKDPYLMAKWNAAESFVISMERMNLLGYTRSFFYDPNPVEQVGDNRSPFSIFYSGNKDKQAVVTGNYDQFRELFRMNKYRDLVSISKKQDRLIRFDFPVMLKVDIIESVKNPSDLMKPQPLPFSFVSVTKDCSTETLVFTAIAREVYFHLGVNDLAHTEQYAQRFFTDRLPLIFGGYSELWELLKTRVAAYRSIVRPYTDFHLVRRSTG